MDSLGQAPGAQAKRSGLLQNRIVPHPARVTVSASVYSEVDGPQCGLVGGVYNHARNESVLFRLRPLLGLHVEE